MEAEEQAKRLYAPQVGPLRCPAEGNSLPYAHCGTHVADRFSECSTGRSGPARHAGRAVPDPRMRNHSSGQSPGTPRRASHPILIIPAIAHAPLRNHRSDHERPVRRPRRANSSSCGPTPNGNGNGMGSSPGSPTPPRAVQETGRHSGADGSIVTSTPKLLCSPGEDRRRLRSRIGEIYRLRSKVVHGAEVDSRDVTQASQEAARLAADVLRVLIANRPDLARLTSAERSTMILME